MPSSETLDVIANAYNPLLALISLLFSFVGVFKSQWKQTGLRLLALAVVACVAYGFQFLDGYLNIWPTFGLDYSTHTAVALGFAIFLSVNARKLKTLWSGFFVGYVLLVLYQRYHTSSDIATTGIVVGIPIFAIVRYVYSLSRTNAANPTPNPDGQN